MPPLYFVWFARPALIIQRRLFYGTSFIATCVHDSPQLCWGFGIVSIKKTVILVFVFFYVIQMALIRKQQKLFILNVIAVSISIFILSKPR